MKQSTRLILLVILLIIAFIAFLGAFMLVEISSNGIYKSELLNDDIWKSAACTVVTMAYPFYYVIKNRKAES